MCQCKAIATMNSIAPDTDFPYMLKVDVTNQVGTRLETFTQYIGAKYPIYPWAITSGISHRVIFAFFCPEYDDGRRTLHTHICYHLEDTSIDGLGVCEVKNLMLYEGPRGRNLSGNVDPYSSRVAVSYTDGTRTIHGTNCDPEGGVVGTNFVSVECEYGVYFIDTQQTWNDIDEETAFQDVEHTFAFRATAGTYAFEAKIGDVSAITVINNRSFSTKEEWLTWCQNQYAEEIGNE